MSAAYQEESISFSPETPGITMDRLLDDLAKGTILHKVLRPFRLRKRKFILDLRSMTFRYEGSQNRSPNATTEFAISSIRDLREGERNLSGKLRSLHRRLCFSVVLDASHSLCLKATSQEERDNWIRGLRYAMHLEEQNHEKDTRIRDAFNMADRNRDGSLDFEEILKLLKTLNADIKKKFVKQMFDMADTKKSRKRDVPTLDREEFVKFYHLLTWRQELELLFMRYSREKGYLNVGDLLRFLREDQKMTKADENYCKRMIHHHEPGDSFKQKEQLSSVGFTNFLTDEEQFLFKPARNKVCQDMTRPITDYFIASSHNTYLAGNQLTGVSEVEAYVTALQKGCRCVEMDCWDGPDGEPVIYHGHTMTSKLLFKEVILAVRQHAFQASEFPLTLSLENHCSVPQQRQMARHLQDILGSCIYSASDDLDHTPSPDDLKRKILIKGKRLPQVTRRLENQEDDDGDDVSIEDQGDEDENSRQQQQQEKAALDKKLKLSPELSNITAMKSVGFKNVSQARGLDNRLCVFSLSESKVEGLMQTNAADLNAISHSKLLRIYPAGSRVGSSNYNPTSKWNHGCQIVALNYQTHGEPMQLNHGRFLDNGGCGYVLKPEFLTSEDKFGIVDGTVLRGTEQLIEIKVISGFQIPKPGDSKKGEVIDPFVKLELHGVDSDKNNCRTKSVTDNGLNPHWNETFTFKVHVPELALMRFVVKDEDLGRDDLIGYYCLPVPCMREGYRHIPLFDKHGEKFPQSLIFLHVSISNTRPLQRAANTGRSSTSGRRRGNVSFTTA